MGPAPLCAYSTLPQGSNLRTSVLSTTQASPQPCTTFHTKDYLLVRQSKTLLYSSPITSWVGLGSLNKRVFTMPADPWKMELQGSQERVLAAKGGHPASYSSRIRNITQVFWLLVQLPYWWRKLYNADKKYIQQNLLMRFPHKCI